MLRLDGRPCAPPRAGWLTAGGAGGEWGGGGWGPVVGMGGGGWLGGVWGGGAGRGAGAGARPHRAEGRVPAVLSRRGNPGAGEGGGEGAPDHHRQKTAEARC